MTTALKRAELQKLSQLSTLKLPTLPAGTPHLLNSLTNENIDFIELASIIEKFPSIAAKLISLVNSAWSSPATPITSLEITCSRLGFGVVRSTSIALAVASPFNPVNCVAFDPENFWCSALLTAEASFRLASLTSPGNNLEPSTARAAGLLHNLGLLWLVDRLPVEVGQALTMVANGQSETLQQALIEALGFDQVHAGGYLGASWQLPEPLLQTLTHYPETTYQDSYSDLVITVGLAVELVSSVLNKESCPGQDVRRSDLGITEDNFKEVFELLSEHQVKIREIAKVLI